MHPLEEEPSPDGPLVLTNGQRNQSTDPNKENVKLNAQAKAGAPKAPPKAALAPPAPAAQAAPRPVLPAAFVPEPKVDEPAEDGPDKFPVPKKVSS